MLDAAHGACRRARAIIERLYIVRSQVQQAGIVMARSIGRRRVVVTRSADNLQCSRCIDAVARSRRSKQSLRGMPERLLNE